MIDERFHSFEDDVTDVALPRQFTWPFHYVPHRLCVIAAQQVQRYVSSRIDWVVELAEGKMLGVLVVTDADGQLGFLAAYSGNLAGRNDHPYFVPPIYDLLNPESEFRRGEREIVEINNKIDSLEQSEELKLLHERRSAMIVDQDAEYGRYKQEFDAAKEKRHAMRAAAQLTDEEREALLHESQFQKAELKRIRKRHSEQLSDIDSKLAELQGEINELRCKRKAMSEALQQRLFELYVVQNAHGEWQSVGKIFSDYAIQTERPHLSVPPGGTGECCAPKLLQYAYVNGLLPVCMAEFWWGASPAGEVRHHGHFYPACRSKCLPLLTFMLQGLDVESNQLAVSSCDDIEELYDDEWLTVVNKPAGMLSEPGKLLSDSVLTRFKTRHPEATGPVLVHRLDQETSGLLVFAKDKTTHKELQRQFAEHEVRKKYMALLDGIVEPDGGIIDLPLRQNAADRPRQMVDFDDGKRAVTMYEVLERTTDGKTWVMFSPVTGRTHQLRVHASHLQGLGIPIVGDMLYGIAADRLMLHATSITFMHPATGEQMTITCPFPQ
ncbi:MAG: RNA pseudouridine synthase [Muribaculaceae bacterium]|nr:RNA pseudouridine synthase [Muribaculaceae bacterium]